LPALEREEKYLTQGEESTAKLHFNYKN
jgi:hypothetical protein